MAEQVRARDEAHDVALARSGDGEAYGRLVARHEDAVGEQMWRFTRDVAEHRELVQDVFVNAFLSLESYRGKGPFLHWLRKVAVRTGYAFWRARRRRSRELALEADAMERLAGEPEEHSAAEAADLVHRVLEKLPERDRVVLTLLYLEERSVAEIAELLGWSRAMVKVQTWRAKRKLERLLDPAARSG